MWSKVRKFLFIAYGEPESKTGGHSLDELQIAAAALLVEAALLDGELDEGERAQIVSACKKRFSIDCDTAHKLVDEAIERQKDAVDIHGFINKFAPHFDHGERLNIIKMLWEVVYADGKLHHYEANLLRRVCGLLGVKDRESGDIRKAVLREMEKAAGGGKPAPAA